MGEDWGTREGGGVGDTNKGGRERGGVEDTNKEGREGVLGIRIREGERGWGYE